MFIAIHKLSNGEDVRVLSLPTTDPQVAQSHFETVQFSDPGTEVMVLDEKQAQHVLAEMARKMAKSGLTPAV